MPHINRIRVNNVKYNFGTQFYDDFMMRFSCKNTIYDLANGGGKSVLMLLLLQNLIPNCTLDDKQPIEKLFRTNEGSSVIHSMIEWRLSDVHIKDGFKYMLTGFCARKSKEQGEEAEGVQEKNGTSIEYFNYCVFYRNFNDNDIKNFPLSSNGERITFTGLKNYLKSLQKNDFNLEVKIFERKGDYQRFIAEYGLYESEWEIIRGINKTEGHVRTYFETNYKTTRKVVEDLLIEEIIEKSFKNRYYENSAEGSLAETLLNIKDKLLELSKKKEEINNFDHQIEIMDGFTERIKGILKLYSGIEDAFLSLKKVYNSLESAEEKNQSDLEEARVKIREILDEKNNLALKVETAKVLVDKKEIASLEEKYESETVTLEAIEEEIKTHIERLNILEGGNHYLEYIQYKKEFDKLKLVMENILKDNSSIMNELTKLVAVKKMANEVITKKLSEEIESELLIAGEEEKNLKDVFAENKNMDNRIAITGYQIEADEERISKLESEIAEKKSHTSLLLPTDARKALKDLSVREEELEALFLDSRLRQEEIRDKIIDLNIKLHDKNYEIAQLEKKKEDYELRENTSLNEYQKLQKIKEVYGEENIDKLIKSVSKTYKNMVLSLADTKEKIKLKEEEIKSLELGKPYVESEQIEEIADYINRYHCRNAMTGIDYLSEIEPDKAEKILNLNPILARSIIVPNNFNQVCFDEKIKDIISKNAGIVVINGEDADFENEEIISSDKAVCLVSEISFDISVLGERLTRAKSELEELNKAFVRKTENEEVVKEDYLFLLMCKENEDGLENPEERLSKIGEEIFALLKDEKEIKDEISAAKKSEANINEDINSLINKRSEIKEEEVILSKLVSMLDEFNTLENTVRTNRDLKLRLEKELKDNKARYDAAENMHNQRMTRISAKQEEMNKISDEWSANYKTYFDENIYEGVKKNIKEKGLVFSNQADVSDSEKLISTDKLDVKLKALLESLKKENSQVADKEKLLNNYQTSMERSLSHIDYMGADVKIFENLYANNELFMTSKSELSKVKRENAAIRERENEARKHLMEIRSVKDKLQGKINHEIATIKEKYGEFNEELIKSEEVYVFLNENSSILGELEAKNDELRIAIKEYENRGITLSILKRDVTKLMAKSDVKPERAAGYLDTDKDIEKECRDVAEKLDEFIEDKFTRAKEFDKEMSLLTDTLKKLNAHELASEIRMNVSMPSDLSETKELINMFNETKELIELEKQRVIRGLDDMQIIKDNFENQCIQSCINIKTELDRLSKLSRITMEDESIPVINLKIPYVKEEFYKERMSDYIDRIAKATDQFENTEDKLKYIRNNLCWKKMFSVIVTDMNSIRLNLYKRERIAAQSRFLPYEEAVGSTGQSQGIYIQFLISVINYISSINGGNADSTRLRKIIFIDNPFGAAKDVYIWEPIFKLLKANNVQLVVPARGATPAITGRFDVNYVLGQKMCEGRQQTVVVDYFSNVNNEEMDYTTLEFEQTALF